MFRKHTLHAMNRHLKRYSWQGVSKPLFYEGPPFCLSPLYRILSNLIPSNLHRYFPFCCFVSLAEKVIEPQLMLFYLMILWIYTCLTFCALDRMICWYQIWYTWNWKNTDTHTHTRILKTKHTHVQQIPWES